jgi:hypothetical protein
MKRIGTTAIVVGFVLAVSNGAFAMAMATGHLDGGGAEWFAVVFGFVLAVACVTVGLYLRNMAIARGKRESLRHMNG